MRRRIAFSFLLLVSSAPVIAVDTTSQRKDWLTGTWILCEDPDRSPKESLQFNPDGTGVVIRSKGKIQFLHKHSGQTVSLLANAHGIAVPIELSASPAFDKLLVHSDRTGNTATYIRSESKKIAACSIK